MFTKSNQKSSTLICASQDNDWSDGVTLASGTNVIIRAVPSADVAPDFLYATSGAHGDLGLGGVFAAGVNSTSAATASSTSGVSTAATATTGTSPAATTGTVATPAWIASLTDSFLKSDMTAASADGTITAVEIAKLITDLGTELTANHTTLSASQLTDLRTIVADINVGETAAPYVSYVTNALVNGNAANTTWTGGAATGATLGNLAVGSTATTLSELEGKWLLGTDLPSSTVHMSGVQAFSVSYSAVAKPLFAASGPCMSDINQGYLGDCYLLSSLAEVANQNPSLIQSMITNNGNNTYGVRFYVNGTAEYVTVSNSLADGGTEFNRGTDIWGSLIEQAYAELQAGGVVTGNSSVNYGNSFSTIGNGGYPYFALEEITGATAITSFIANGSSWYKAVYNSSLSQTSGTSGLTTASVLSTLVADLAKGNDLVLGSNTTAYDAAGKMTLVSGHAMSIYGYDSATGNLEIRNPWGTMTGQYWDTTFEVGLSTLLAAGDSITVDNMTSTPAILPPTLTMQTANQLWVAGQKVSLTLPGTTFTDPQGTALTYSAKTSAGAALPAWLTFANGTFSGTVPTGMAAFGITVTATDAAGLSATETFNVAPPAAPVLAVQTATQTETVGKAFSYALASATFNDPNGAALTYSATQSNGAALPAWLTFNASTETFSGVAPTTVGTTAVMVKAIDAYGLSATDTFSFVVKASAAPVVAAQTAAQIWHGGQTLSLTLPSNTFTDPNGQTLTYSATLANGSALPSWLTFNTHTDAFTGTVPNSVQALSLKVTATDTSGLSVAETFSANILAASAPVVTLQTAAQALTASHAFTITLPSNTFTDPQGETLTYSATQANGSALPSWLTFNGQTETFTGTAPATAQTLSLKVTAKDAAGLSASETFNASIAAPAGPLLANQTAPQTWMDGKADSLSFANVFSDPAGLKMSYAVYETAGPNVASWMTYNPNTLVLSGTPPATLTGTATMEIIASDASGHSAMDIFNITFAHGTTAIVGLVGVVPVTSEMVQIHG